MTWLRFRLRHAELDARVAAATAGAESAREEAATSRTRQETVRGRVVSPLLAAADRNSFFEMIRDSLTVGYGEGK